MVSAHIINLLSEYCGKKWRGVVMIILMTGPKRFSEIHKYVPDCSVKVLSDVLKDMTKQKLIIRKQYATIPVKVTYELNKDFIKVINRYHQCVQEFAMYLDKSTGRK